MNDSQAANFQCDLTPIDAVQRKRRAQLASEVWSQSREMKELATGYEFRFDFSPSLLSNIAELAALEHLCCPFFNIGVKLVKDNGPLWLQITGDPGVKEFLRAELKL